MIAQTLARQAEERADNLFLVSGGDRLTFGDSAERAERIAGRLNDAGVQPGQRVAVLSSNRTEILDLYFGCARLGAVQVPINAFLKGEFLRYQLDDAQASTLVVDDAGWKAALPLLDRLPDLRRVIVLDDAATAPPAAVDLIPFPELLDGKALCTAPMPDADTLMTIGYTSGTTGPPKGCMLTQGYYARVAARVEDTWALTDDDTIISAMPLFHGAGRMMVVAAALRRGIPAVIEGQFHPTAFLDRARHTGATVAFGVGAMGMAMLATPPADTDREHSLRLAMWIPFPMDAQLRFEERFGVATTAEGYGQTECVPVTYTPAGRPGRRDTAGRPAPDLEVRLVDDAGAEVPPGVPGEIVLRPANPHAMFAGYWRKPEATLESFRGLWYHTGDYGRRDEDGFITFVDRKKDALRRRGENVSSLELEQAIAAHPGIAEAAVHAVPSALTEDDIKACIVVAEGVSVGPEELFAFFKENFPYYAIPRYVEVLPELPKNAVARVMKHLLRERGVTESTWDFEVLGLTVPRAERR